MERGEFEQALLDPQFVKRLLKQAKRFQDSPGEHRLGSGHPVSRVKQVEHTAYARRPTAEEAHANDSNFVVRSGANVAVTSFLSAERGTDLLTDLRLARKACYDKPTDANRLLLELAINQLTSARELDEKEQKDVDDAMKVLISEDRPKVAHSLPKKDAQ
jgi:hypothetical protein